MSTKKSNKERSGGDFRSRPFSALKGFAAPRRTVPEPPPAERGGEDDDNELFRQAMNGARPLDRGREDAGPVPRQKETGSLAAPDASDARLFLDAMQTIGTASFGERSQARQEEAGRRSASSRMRQLRRGSLRIGQELDLHGFVRDEAMRRLEHFISSAAARGHAAVLVITGKGTNSPEGPVLPEAVASWFRGPGARLVAEFHQAPRDKGGSGAYVVFLRRH